MSIPDHIIEAVRERTSLVDVVSETVSLRRSGKNFVGLCPFHSEKTPSFNVNDEEGFFRCFGCGEKGTVYNFLMKTRGYTFPEAVRYLAAKAGIRIAEESSERSQANDRAAARMRLLRHVCRIVSQVYQSQLAFAEKGHAGQAYLRERGIRDETAKLFSLGFAPDSWEFLLRRAEAEIDEQAASAGLTPEKLPELLVETGLLKQRSGTPAAGSSQEWYDVFRNRLIFPISRSDGAPIAFGGRLLRKEANAPKYLNTSESVLYAKRRSFYGLHQALPFVRKSRHVYLVEGYLDVLSMFQAGFPSTIATCGTSVTADHARMLGRFASRLSIVFDGDTAGRKAAAHCFPVLLNSGVEIEVVLLPDGEDPDTLAQRLSHDQLTTLLNESRHSIVEVYLDWLRTEVAGESADESSDVASAALGGKVAARYAAVVSHVVNPVERELLVRQAADYLGVSAQSIDDLVRNYQRRSAKLPNNTGDLYHVTAGVTAQAGKTASEPPEIPAGLPLPPADLLEPPANPVQLRRARTDRDAYYRQLVVALLCEPALARQVLVMPSLMPDAGVFAALPDAVQSFVEALAARDYTGVFQLAAGGTNDERDAGELQELLTRHRLDAQGLLQEAFRQARIGGANPTSVVADARRETARRLLDEEMQKIREEESKADSAQQLERLAQEKLARKRSLSRLRNGSDG